MIGSMFGPSASVITERVLSRKARRVAEEGLKVT